MNKIYYDNIHHPNSLSKLVIKLKSTLRIFDSLKLFFFDDDGPPRKSVKKLDKGGFTLPEPDVRDKFVNIPGSTIRRIFKTSGPSSPEPSPPGGEMQFAEIVVDFLEK